jgi:solute carrier family 35, member F1/2
VSAYALTSLTSVSIISDIAIPSAVLLSVCFLKVKYSSVHFGAIALVCVGVLIGFVNDYYQDRGSGSGRQPLLGDLLALLGGFLYALENVLMEHFVRKPGDVFNFLGFIGFFGMLLTLFEAWLMSEFE